MLCKLLDKENDENILYPSRFSLSLLFNFAIVVLLIVKLSILDSYIYLCLFRYATASARSDGLLLLCGGRDANSVVSQKILYKA